MPLGMGIREYFSNLFFRLEETIQLKRAIPINMIQYILSSFLIKRYAKVFAKSLPSFRRVSLFRITNDCLLAVRTDRNDLDGHTKLFFEE